MNTKEWLLSESKAYIWPIENYGELCNIVEEYHEYKSRWRPISTAPKDGTRILLYYPHSNKPRSQVGYYDVSKGIDRFLFADGFLRLDGTDASHWLPLPEDLK